MMGRIAQGARRPLRLFATATLPDYSGRAEEATGSVS
jgi:hypothetical protein